MIVKIIQRLAGNRQIRDGSSVLTRSGVMEKCSIDIKKIKDQAKEIRLCFEWEGNSSENRLYSFYIGLT